MNRVSRASPSPPSNAGVKSLKATNILNVDEGRAIYWSNSRFPRTRRSPQARRGGGNQYLFNTRARAPAHFPEVGLEPGRLLKDRDQLGLARGRDIEIGKAVQVRMRLRRDLLVWRTGILVDPDAIGVRCGARIGSRCEPEDLARGRGATAPSQHRASRGGSSRRRGSPTGRTRLRAYQPAEVICRQRPRRR